MWNLILGVLQWFRPPKPAKRSSKWPEVRKMHLEREPLCQACGRKRKLQVHHIEPFHLKPAKELDENNLITLCDQPCHLVFGHFMNWKLYNPNVVEDCNYYMVHRTKAVEYNKG